MTTTSTSFSWRYDRAEIIADAIVHAIGLVLAAIGVVALIMATAWTNPSTDVVAATVYGSGLLAALAASSAYNIWPVSPIKWILRRIDHSAIFVLIAATYTPFLAQMPAGPMTTVLFSGIWGTAATGILIKCFFPGRFDRLAVLLYLALGWSGILVYPTLVEVLGETTLWLILAGGIVYSAGVIFHLWERLRFQNAIWHGFVMAGAGIHYGAIFNCLVGTQAG